MMFDIRFPSAAADQGLFIHLFYIQTLLIQIIRVGSQFLAGIPCKMAIDNHLIVIALCNRGPGKMLFANNGGIVPQLLQAAHEGDLMVRELADESRNLTF